MAKQDVDKLRRLVRALDALAKVGEDVMEDGKIDFSDAMKLGPAADPLKELVALWSDGKEMLAEMRDIDWVELKILIDELK